MSVAASYCRNSDTPRQGFSVCSALPAGSASRAQDMACDLHQDPRLPMLTIVVTGRNDDYGGDFRRRLFRTAEFNARRLTEAGHDFEYLWVEWNPLLDVPLLSEEFVQRVPHARAIVVPKGI